MAGPLLDGKMRSASAITEPAVASSDAPNIERTITRSRDHYVINGRKWWATGAPDRRCKILIVMGQTDRDNSDRYRRQSMILVPKDTPGVTVVRALPLRSAATWPTFTSVQWPASNRYGWRASNRKTWPGFVGIRSYNAQTAVDTENHLIVAHEVSNVGSDRSQLANTVKTAKEALGTETLEAVADRGYFNSEEIKTCVDASVTVTLPKPMTSLTKADGRFGKEDSVYLAEENVYRSQAGEKLTYRFTAQEHGQKLHRYWTNACRNCPLKSRCTPGLPVPRDRAP